MPVTTVSDPLPTPHSSEAERLRRIVADAWSATDPVADQVDSETRQTAFKLLLEAMLQNGQSILSTVEPTEPDDSPPPPPPPQITEAPIDRAFATEVQRIDAVSMSLGIEYEDVQSLYDLSRLEPALRLNPAKLATEREAALREITLLVSAVRGALGLDTGTRHLREAAAAHGKLDAARFNATMECMPDIALRGHPDSDNRFVGLRGKGFAAAGELARRLVRE